MSLPTTTTKQFPVSLVFMGVQGTPFYRQTVGELN